MRADVRPKRLGGAVEFVHAAVQIVDHEPRVSIHVPVQPGLADVLRSAGDAIGHRDGDARGEKIVQNDMAVTGG
jgi:hypothetical protein